MSAEQMREGLGGYAGGLEQLFRDLETSGASVIKTLERDGSSLAAARFNLSNGPGRNYWEFFRLGPDLYAIIVNALYPDRVTIPVTGEDFIEFHFRLSGGLSLAQSLDKAVDVGEGSLLIWRQPRGCDVLETFLGSGRRESSITIYCRPSFIARCFGAIDHRFDPRLAEALGLACERIVALQAVLYPGLTRLLLDLAADEHQSGLELVRAEALAMQIVAEVLAKAPIQDQVQNSSSRLSDKDVGCLNAARRIVLREHAPAPTIDELARRVGLSPTKLKFGFRLLFGQTISEFATGERMKAACELLRQSDKPISHVSAELGYEYQNSFTVAFRRHYGVLPKDYRRDPLRCEALFDGAA